MDNPSNESYVQHSLKHIVKGVERLTQGVNSQISTDISCFFKKHKEKFLSFSQKMLSKDENMETHLSSWSTIAIILRLKPPEAHNVCIGYF